MIVEETFGVYKATVEAGTGCWIEYKKASASLQCLMDFGYIEDDNTGDQYNVPQSVINEIEEWALENGY